tara:strand:+ start:136 stop:432 length:297 start_codon:yes stop_codon:yes gene_type:complete
MDLLNIEFEKSDTGLFYKSQFHQMHSLNHHDLDELKKKENCSHISDVMDYLKEKHRKTDHSIYEDIKSRSRLASIILDPQIKPTIFGKRVTAEIKKHQ